MTPATPGAGGRGRRGTTQSPAPLDIRLLGPVLVLRDGSPIEIGGPRAETLLAVLAMQPGSAVSADSLIDELWAGEAPDGAEVTIRSYVSRLRSALGDAAPIERLPAGYVLRLPAHAVDVVRFEALVHDGRDLLERRRHRRAAEVLRSALQLWRGRPFAGLAEDGAFRPATTRLQELRLLALESRIQAQLEIGLHAELVDELEGLVDANPFRERLWRHLMLALYRSGRQADALSAYHRARAALDEQLGIEPGAELQELEAAVLRQDVAPAAEPSTAVFVSVPAPLTSFIGRGRELDELAARLRTNRLVTLVGIGGVGKTRLAIEVARSAGPELADRVAFVDLSSLSDPEALAAHVAAALGVREQQGADVDRTLAAHVGALELLLVLDNCEHLLDAVAGLVRMLLDAAGGLRVLATSREPLALPGEMLVPVDPLTLPPAGAPLSELRTSDAVRLLLERATATRAGLAHDDAAIETAAAIVKDLDGLPLAIELAAARATALSLQEIADRLRDRFQFLVSWRRLASTRHRTLREAMDWSYELLTPAEREALAALSVFAGPFDLAAVARVCLDGDDETALRLVERLVGASLVVLVGGADRTRYRLLETVRQYAADHLTPEAATAHRRRLAEHLLTTVEGARLSMESPAGVQDYDLVATELPNIRVALATLVTADPSLGLSIACAMERFWVTNSAREGIAVFTALLAAPGVPDGLRARGLRCRGGCRFYTADYAGAEADYAEALSIHRALGDRIHVAHLLTRFSVHAVNAGDVAKATRLLEEARMTSGDQRALPDAYVEGQVNAAIAFRTGDPDRGLALLDAAIAQSRENGDLWWTSGVLQHQADEALRLGRLDIAEAASRESLRLADRVGDRQGVVYSLSNLAFAASARGRQEHAGRLWGAIEAEIDRGGPLGQWELEQERDLSTVRDGDPAPFDAGRRDGRQLPLADVVREALQPPD